MRIWCFPRSRLSNRGLARQWFALPQLYCIIIKWQTPGKRPSPFFLPLVLLFPLSFKIFKVFIFYIYSLATIYFIQKFSFPYLVFLLVLLYLNLLLFLVLPLFLLSNYVPFISQLYILYLLH